MAGNDPNGADSNPPPANPPAQAARPSLRDIAEAAYDEVNESPAPIDENPDAGQNKPARDNLGRYAPKDAQPGVAEGEVPPGPETVIQADPNKPDPAQGSQAPTDWSAADREMFGKLPTEAKSFLSRRYSEMEAGYTRKYQANAQAVEFAQSLAPVFSDPVISESLKLQSIAPAQAIVEWATFHKMFVQDPAKCIAELQRRAGIDPAAPADRRQDDPISQLSEADQKDPAIRYIADHFGRQQKHVLTLEQQLQRVTTQLQERDHTEAMRAVQWNISSFENEKDAQGNLLHPHFARVLPHIVTLFKADPDKDLQSAYDTACRMDSDLHAETIAAERKAAEQRAANQKAAAQVRGNLRGTSAPVSRPAPGSNGSGGLRDVLEQTADEVGFK